MDVGGWKGRMDVGGRKGLNKHLWMEGAGRVFMDGRGRTDGFGWADGH
jgi:hypothetical protein